MDQDVMEQAEYAGTRPSQRDKICHMIRNALLNIEAQRRIIFQANCKIAVVIMKLEEDLSSMRGECEAGRED